MNRAAVSRMKRKESKGNMAHINLPGFVALHKYISKEALEELMRWAYEVTRSDQRAVGAAYRALVSGLPDADARLAAIRELGILAQSALKRAG